MSENTSKQYLCDYSPDDKKWDFHKAATEKIEFFYSSSKKFAKYGKRMESCSELLRFIYVDNLTSGESKLKLSSAKFCRVRLCPVCQWRRSMAWRARLFQKLPLLLEQEKDLNFIFLTLTIKNCDIFDLSDHLSLMNNAFAKLRKLKSFGKVIKGFIRATEVTKSGEMAHPHFHCILAVKKSYFTSRNYIKTEKWAEMWKDCLNVDYLPVVDARKIRQKGDQLESKAVIETLKYTTKVEDLLSDRSWFLVLTEQLYKKRFIATGGCFKDILKDKVTDKEMLLNNDESDNDKEEELRKSLFFGWKTEVKKYKKVRNPFL